MQSKGELLCDFYHNDIIHLRKLVLVKAVVRDLESFYRVLNMRKQEGERPTFSWHCK